MCDFDCSWFNNDEHLMVLQIGGRTLKEVLNYHIYAGAYLGGPLRPLGCQ